MSWLQSETPPILEPLWLPSANLSSQGWAWGRRRPASAIGTPIVSAPSPRSVHCPRRPEEGAAWVREAGPPLVADGWLLHSPSLPAMPLDPASALTPRRRGPVPNHAAWPCRRLAQSCNCPRHAGSDPGAASNSHMIEATEERCGTQPPPRAASADLLPSAAACR